MVVERCPRCDGPLYEIDEPRGGRGRPRRWCSVECRKLAEKERRAAERGTMRLGMTLPVPTEKAINLPRSSERAGDRMSGHSLTTEQLLRTLTLRMRAAPVDPVGRGDASRVVPLLADLLDVCRRASGMPEQATAGPTRAAAPQHAVATVLASPRATRDLLDTLTDKARAGELLAGQHSGTVHAALRLLRALAESRTIR
jgi:hypothetical protein